MSITTASGASSSASSTASCPSRARPAKANRSSCSSTSAITSRNVSSSSATRIRNGGLSSTSYLRPLTITRPHESEICRCSNLGNLMAPVRPEDLNLSSLPRSPLGHLKADAVADLLQRAAWDYREALAHNRQLASTVEELTQQVEERTGQVASLEAAAAQHKDPDELARTLLASAQRTAREEREAARRDAELTLTKGARRSARIEDDVARRQAALL